MLTAIASMNAKVFEVNGEEVTIWHVVEVHVRAYERQILG